jgi:hypothetical protein
MSRRDTPEVRQRRGSPEPVSGRCGRQLALTDPPRYCTQFPLAGRDACKFHGGKSLRGFEHPKFNSGMFTSSLKALGLGKHYEVARQNAAITSLTDYVALVDGKILELFEQLASGEGPVAWKRALDTATDCADAMNELRAAINDRSPNRGALMSQALLKLDPAIQRMVAVTRKGTTDAEVWPTITDNIYLRKKLVDSEVKRRKAESETLMKAQVVDLMAFIAKSVHRHVTDPKAKQAIVDDIRLVVQGEVVKKE